MFRPGGGLLAFAACCLQRFDDFDRELAALVEKLVAHISLRAGDVKLQCRGGTHGSLEYGTFY